MEDLPAESQVESKVADDELANFTNDSAMMIAYERALETAKGPEVALFQDPFAKLLQGPKGEHLSNDFGANAAAAFEFEGWPDFHKTWTAIRTRFIDDKVEEHVDKEGFKVTQVVNLGAGLDTRPYRLKCYKNFQKCFDVDVEKINDMKKKVFKLLRENDKTFHALCSEVVDVSLDLLDNEKNLSTELTKVGFLKDKPTIFIAEGLIMYLGAGKERFLGEVSNAAAPGSILILNFMEGKNEEAIRIMDPTYMSQNSLIESLSNKGWDKEHLKVNKFGDDVLNYGRYPNNKFPISSSFSFLVCRKLR